VYNFTQLFASTRELTTIHYTATTVYLQLHEGI